MTTPPPPNQVQQIPVATISIVDVFTKQIEMQSQLAVINEKLADLPDHEARLRILEQTRYKLYGACATLSVLFGGAAAWAVSLLTHRH